jgi:hypothetical protein
VEVEKAELSGSGVRVSVVNQLLKVPLRYATTTNAIARRIGTRSRNSSDLFMEQDYTVTLSVK